MSAALGDPLWAGHALTPRAEIYGDHWTRPIIGLGARQNLSDRLAADSWYAVPAEQPSTPSSTVGLKLGC